MDFNWFVRREKERPTNVHPLSNAGAGKGVSLQQISHEAATYRDSARPLSYGETDKNLVSEQADEMEEGEQV